MRFSSLPLLLATLVSPTPLGSQELASHVGNLASARLEATETRFVANLSLAAGPATLRLERGFLFPVATAAGAGTGEFVFVGRGRLLCDPPNALEADQLEVFTEQRQLDVEFSSALLAIGSRAVRQSLLGRPIVTAEPADLASALEKLRDWRADRAREILGTAATLVRVALAPDGFEEYFAATVSTLDFSDIHLLIDPEAEEQVTLGRFVPVELEDREERKLRRALHREQRRGRLIGVDLDDLGSWDNWISAALASGPGRAPYETRHYRLDVVAEDFEPLATPRLRVSARMELEVGPRPNRSLVLRLPNLATVTSIRRGDGATELPFQAVKDEVLVVLDTVPEPGSVLPLVVEYHGPFFERAPGKGKPRWYLPSSTGWYPQVGERGRATYDVTIDAPAELEIVGPGSVEGQRGRFELSRPTFGFTFEIGRFRRLGRTVAGVPITVFTDDHAELASVYGEEILEFTANAVEYLTTSFGTLPVAGLTVVTAPRSYSQSFLGHLVLAEDMMSVRRRFSDARTVIAHEVAHQWWGHQADFSNYRDQWLSEALANYSAVLFAREKLGSRTFTGEVGPLYGWNVVLPALVDNGRTLENLGPVVLGGRLDSSLADAYVPIVYWKGALLVDMLDNVFGQGQFLDILRKLLAEHADKPFTTEAFLAGLAEHGGVNLDEFARRFVYGVGLPEVYFDYEFRKLAEGKWEVVGKARQEAPYRYEYRLVPGDGGAWPRLVRRGEAQSSVSARTWLPVPIEIGVFDPALPTTQPKSKTRGAYRAFATGTSSALEKKAAQATLEREGNSVIRGRTLLRGEETSFRFETEFEPRAVWFDRWHEVFCRFFDQQVEPKRTALYRALDHAAAERFSEAEAALREALTAPVTEEPLPDTRWVKRFLADEGESLDVSIHLTLTRIHLAQGRVPAAQSAWQSANNALGSRGTAAQRSESRLLAAHLALAHGRPNEVHRFLAKNGRKNPELTSREANALRAIAYWAEGNRGALATVRREAEGDGVDLSLLDAPSP